MATYRCGSNINDCAKGKGWRCWENRRFFIDYWYGPADHMWEYVCKRTGVSVLTVVVPLVDDQGAEVAWYQEALSMDWLSKAAAAQAMVVGRNAAKADEAFAAKFPALTAFMTTCEQEGKPRETSKLQLFVDDGVWKAALHDGHTSHSLFATLGAVQDVFKALEKALTAERPDWRPWGKKRDKKR